LGPLRYPRQIDRSRSFAFLAAGLPVRHLRLTAEAARRACLTSSAFWHRLHGRSRFARFPKTVVALNSVSGTLDAAVAGNTVLASSHQGSPRLLPHAEACVHTLFLRLTASASDLHLDESR
jgi:hypothetical protein